MRVVFVVHNHQPIGNLDEVIERITDDVYLPLLDLFRRGEGRPLVVHNSGPLWEWWSANRPEVVEAFRSLPAAEFLAGGWFEPVLAAIPENDRVEQLTLGMTRLEALTGTAPLGVWLGERFWEPSLAGTLNRRGLAYTVLDGEHLPPGMPASRPYTVDYHGRTLEVFFISQAMRYAVPNAPVDEIMALLEQQAAADPDGAVVIGDDGEKFGAWANDYSAEWLDELLSRIESHPELELSTLNDAHAALGSAGHVSLPSGSYAEMNEWSGGYWPSLVTGRRESMVLYRRMLRLSRLTRRAGDDARHHLLRGQCNDAYWHGAFGGSNLPFLRQAVAGELIAARAAHDTDNHRSQNWCEAEAIDWNADGRTDLHVELPHQSWVLSESSASLFYIDDKPTRWALSDVPGDCAAPAFRDRREDGPSEVYTLESFEAGKGTLNVTLQSSGIRKTFVADQRELVVSYDLNDQDDDRLGPVIPLAIDDSVAVRVDGGEPVPLIEAITVEGHRFRIVADHGPGQVLIDLRVPGRLVSRPIVTSFTDENGSLVEVFHGVELWVSYRTQVSGRYDFRMEVIS